MNDQKDTVFVNSIKADVKEGDGWIIPKIGICLNDSEKDGRQFEGFWNFCKKHSKNGWINIDIKKSKKTGKWYAQLDTYEKQSENNQQPSEPSQGKIEDPEDIPF